MPDLHEDEPAAPITAGDPPGPLPSELLESCDGGRGIAAFVLTPEALDRLPILTRWPAGGQSDGYLDDAESWGTQDELVAYARSSGHGVVPTREVLALLRLDRILGNEHALSEVGTGRVRGVVTTAIREWHDRQRAIAEQLGPSDPTGGPFPVADALLGQRPDPAAQPTTITAPRNLDLQQHPLALRTYAPGLVTFDGRVLRIEYDEAEPGVTTLDLAHRLADAEADVRLARGELDRKAAEWDQRSREGREQVGRLVATADDLREQLRATRADQLAVIEERDDARRQLVEHGEAAEAQADALRAEVARLSGLLDEEVPRRARAELNLAAQQQTTETLRGHLDAERARAEAAEGLVEPVELYVPAEARVSWDGTKLRALYLRPYHGEVGSEAYPDGKGRPLTIEDVREEREGDAPVEPVIRAEVPPTADLPELPADPRRPRPDWYPEDAVTLTYRELRQLLALHVAAVADSIQSAAGQARAMRDGETPLRLAEVLDR